MHSTTKKTNKQWYPFKNLGSFYKLEEGVLLQAAMNVDGTIDMWDDEVNAGEVTDIEPEDEKKMENVMKELERKP